MTEGASDLVDDHWCLVWSEQQQAHHAAQHAAAEVL